MDKMKAITFFDLDGTLLDGTSQITPEITAKSGGLERQSNFTFNCDRTDLV